MIRDGQVVLIDGGTTNLRIASYFQESVRDDVTTATLALALADHRVERAMLEEIFLSRSGHDRQRPFVESNPFALICVFRNVRLHPEVGITVGTRRSVREASDDRASTEVVG